MISEEQLEAEDFVIKVYRVLQAENPEYRVAFFAFLTLAVTLANEMGIDNAQFMHYANTVLDNDRDIKISELQ